MEKTGKEYFLYKIDIGVMKNRRKWSHSKNKVSVSIRTAVHDILIIKQPVTKTPAWLYAVSFLSGAIIYFLIGLLLYKVGFFKRKRHHGSVEPDRPFSITDLQIPNFVYTQNKNISTGAKPSYFGLSLLLQKDRILVGAPRANSSLASQESINESGLLYICSVTENKEECKPFVLEKNGNIKYGPENETERRDNQWLGASISGNVIGKQNGDNPFMVCAPLVKTFKYFRISGVCYIQRNIKTDSKKYKQSLPDYEKYKHYSRMFLNLGFSSHWIKEREIFLTGTPTCDGNRGAFTHYNLNNGKGKLVDSVTQSDSYGGYSITSGILNKNGAISYIISAPRYKGVGNVIVVNENNLNKRERVLTGSQPYEYFGYSVIATDINQDGLSDIIVSAPFYSLKNRYEVGAIYIYDSINNYKKKEIIVAPSKFSYGRFGLSLASLGDINLDGYNDIAVGAPYEKNGKVYIYQGSSNGLYAIPLQILESPKFSDEIHLKHNFGFTISNGADIDSNGVNDIVVSAVNIDTVYLYKAYPIDKYKSVNQELYIKHLCDGNRTCNSNLKVEIEKSGRSILLVDLNRYLTVSFKTQNLVGNDPAYLPRINITTNQNIPLYKESSKCKMLNLQNKERILQCALSNEENLVLQQNETQILNLTFDISNLKGSKLIFKATVSSSSNEIDHSDNVASLTFAIVGCGDIEVIETSLEGSQFINLYEGEEQMIEFEKTFQIKNAGPSTLTNLNFSIQYPIVSNFNSSKIISPVQPLKLFLNDEVKLNLNEINDIGNNNNSGNSSIELLNSRKERSAVIEGVCIDTTHWLPSLYSEFIKVIPFENKIEFDTISSENLHTKSFIIDKLKTSSTSVSEIIIKFKVNQKDLWNLLKKYNTEFFIYKLNFIASSQLCSNADDCTPTIFTFRSKVEEIIIKTVPIQKSEIWIYAVSFVIGLIVYFLIAFLFYKLGFFKRKKHEEVKDFKRQSIMRQSMRITAIPDGFDPRHVSGILQLNQNDDLITEEIEEDSM
ncbi:uncharacterized protein LOC129610828 [Condylostylus longicornis]|uniref:uncharacterized protein LOC129610828 n=1 Tax=Condylostylus longicornis TaxID=2530218 RepID=UPI00244DFE54|nr:uncharacterized protein LOC129610828 [Condylostylus longicornis]